MRFYEIRIEETEDSNRFVVTVKNDDASDCDVLVDEVLARAIVLLQRRHNGEEKRFERIVDHLMALPPESTPYERYAKSPEDILIEMYEAAELTAALFNIPAKQSRRFLLRYMVGLSVQQIADIEGCTRYAAHCSIECARNNLRKILDE